MRAAPRCGAWSPTRGRATASLTARGWRERHRRSVGRGGPFTGTTSNHRPAGVTIETYCGPRGAGWMRPRRRRGCGRRSGPRRRRGARGACPSARCGPLGEPDRDGGVGAAVPDLDRRRDVSERERPGPGVGREVGHDRACRGGARGVVGQLAAQILRRARADVLGDGGDLGAAIGAGEEPDRGLGGRVEPRADAAREQAQQAGKRRPGNARRVRRQVEDEPPRQPGAAVPAVAGQRAHATAEVHDRDLVGRGMCGCERVAGAAGEADDCEPAQRERVRQLHDVVGDGQERGIRGGIRAQVAGAIRRDEPHARAHAPPRAASAPRSPRRASRAGRSPELRPGRRAPGSRCGGRSQAASAGGAFSEYSTTVRFCKLPPCRR